MIEPEAHPRELERLEALRRTGLLDSPPELAFDDIVRVAAVVADTPVALVSLVDEDRQWFKAKVGLDADETPRAVAFCAHAILDPETTLEVADATADPRFFDNPLVVGGPRVIFYVGVPLRDPTTKLPLGTLCVIDHHARTLEAPQRLALEALARQVESTLVLRQHAAELARARAEADETARDKSRFLAVMSHEVRTPVHGITGLVEMLERGDLGPKERFHVDQLARVTHALRCLLNDILDFSKLDEGAIELEKRPLDLTMLGQEGMSVVEAEAAAKGLSLAVNASLPFGPWIAADATRLRQIIVNLLSNAVKFTGEGSVSLSFSGTSDAVVITVEDTGIGIPAHALARLFSAFHQADRSTTRKYGGTGLGLAICSLLTEAMGGDIDVSSRVGVGSRFVVRLPVEYCEPETENTVEADVGTNHRWSRPLRVLVADDDAINRLVVRGMLEHLGVQAHVVADGQDAVDALAAGGEFDVVLLDHEMPGLDGCETLSRIRRDHGDAMPPCAVVTASALPGAEVEFLSAGFDAYLSKPVTAEHLEATLRKLVA